MNYRLKRDIGDRKAFVLLTGLAGVLKRNFPTESSSMKCVMNETHLIEMDSPVGFATLSGGMVIPVDLVGKYREVESWHRADDVPAWFDAMADFYTKHGSGFSCPNNSTWNNYDTIFRFRAAASLAKMQQCDGWRDILLNEQAVSYINNITTVLHGWLEVAPNED